MAIDPCHCRALRQAARRVTQFYDEKLERTGLRTTQFSMLAIIQDLGEVSVKDLAQHLDLDRTTTGKNLRPLERAGLVSVQASAKDGRSRAIGLTADGRRALAAATPIWRRAQAEFETENGSEATRVLRTALTSLKAGPSSRDPGEDDAPASSEPGPKSPRRSS